MSMRTAELVSEWETVSFEGGYSGLHSLADRQFSGAVIVGSAQLFMLRGTVVGILDGDIEQFEDSGGTAREAPHDALPLLTVMQAQAEEPRAQYYTEDTPLSEVDGTLSDGGFTGFIELSENVLSGDYYLIYHQGRSMTVAWVGSSQQLLTDDEAFEQANDEVGIYDVFSADIEPIELPEIQADDGAGDDTVAGGGDADTPLDTDEEAGISETEISDLSPETETFDDMPGAGTAEDTTTVSGDTDSGHDPEWLDDEPTVSDGTPEGRASDAEQVSTVETETNDTRQTDVPKDDTADSAATQETDSGQRLEQEPQESTTTESESDGSEADQPVPADQQSGPTPEQESGQSTEPAATPTDADEASATLEIRSIPSLDPDRSRANTGQPDGMVDQADGMVQPTTTRTEPTTNAQTDTGGETVETAPPEQESQLRRTLTERENEIQQLQTEIDDLKAENENLKAERGRIREELEEARSEIQRLQRELDDATAPTDALKLSAAEAIDETNLFVRYRSKSGATLDKAIDESADSTAVTENLRLEHHTQFEDESAIVDGQEFEAFLHGTIQYRFVKWLVHNLLYEIRDTGHAGSMSVLYNALPKIDRAELNGAVSVTYTEDGEQHRTQEEFDVVVRDRMGNPLIVANINDSRQPATGGQMRNIVQDAELVGNTSDSLAAAFLVTNSFFEPEALEIADEATASGLLSRDKGKSFVNLSRKDGYHLCLLEARNDEFHLAVPEL